MRTHYVAQSLAAAMGLILRASAPATGTEYTTPRVSVTPARPTPEDSVVVQCILGWLPTDCVFRYSGDCDISRTDFTTYPPEYRVYVDCAAMPPPRGVPCTDTVTEYGPVVHAGLLPCGLYHVFPAGATSEIATFSVRPAQPGFVAGGVITALWPLGPTGTTLLRLDNATIDSGDTSFAPCDTLLSDAVYWFDGLDSGTYRIVYENPAFVTHEERFSVPVQGNVSLMGAGLTGTVDGRVVDWMYHPLAGCTVSLSARMADTSQPDSLMATRTTDSLGQFAFDSIPATRGEAWLCYTVSVSPAGYDGQAASGCLSPPELSRTHRFRLTSPQYPAPPQCVSRVVDSISYRACVSLVPLEQECDSAPGGVVQRVRARFRYVIENVGSVPWDVPVDTVDPCVWSSLSSEPSYPYRPYWGGRGIPVDPRGHPGEFFLSSYFPEVLNPHDTVSIGLGVALDTVLGCRRFALADTVWIGGGIAELGPQALFDSLLVVVEGEVVGVRRPVAVRRPAASRVVRVSGDLLTVSLPLDAVVSIAVFSLDGRLWRAWPGASLWPGGHTSTTCRAGPPECAYCAQR